MSENSIMISSKILATFIIISLALGFFLGGSIGYLLAPTGGEDFDLPDKPYFTMAFILPTPEDVEKIQTNAETLTAFLEERMGIEVRIYPLTNNYENIIFAFESNTIDAAFMDGGPSHFVVNAGLGEVVLSELRSGTNLPYYNVAAWVRANSTIDSLETMVNGSFISSHTSATGTAGMIMPVGTLIKEGYMETQSDDDTMSLLGRYFADSTIGGSYGGALQRVLDNQADVAFVRDTTPLDLFPDRADELRLLHIFGKAPSHPVVVSTSLAEGWKFKFVNAMLELNQPENVEILQSLYNSPGLVGANNLHIKDLSEAVAQLFWLEDTILGRSS
jgi:phosphonate transport system substrate-binding protein